MSIHPHTASINDSSGVNSCRAYIIHEGREIKPRKLSWIESFTIRCVVKNIHFLLLEASIPEKEDEHSEGVTNETARRPIAREREKLFFPPSFDCEKRERNACKSFARAWKLSRRPCLSDERSQSRKLGDRSVHSAIAVTSLERSVKVEKNCFSSLFFCAVPTIDFLSLSRASKKQEEPLKVCTFWGTSDWSSTSAKWQVLLLFVRDKIPLEKKMWKNDAKREISDVIWLTKIWGKDGSTRLRFLGGKLDKFVDRYWLPAKE